MKPHVELPFGLVANVYPAGAVMLGESTLASEFRDQDDTGSKSVAAAQAFEAVVLALLAAGYDLDTQAGHLALRSAAAKVADRL